MADDLFSRAPTPYTDRHVYKASPNDVGFEVIAPTIARELEDLVHRLAKALERGPFESEDSFAERRKFAHELYTKFKDV